MTYVALFRGINVGGKKALPMKQLVALLEALGYQGVTSYIQSGNVVFSADETDRAAIAGRIATAVEARFGFSPVLMLLTLPEIEQAVAENPFPEGEDSPTTLHVAFLGGPPRLARLDDLGALTAPNERWRLAGRTLYFWAPEGFARSKFPTSAERLLGVPTTFRNWRTVVTILDMARGGT